MQTNSADAPPAGTAPDDVSYLLRQAAAAQRLRFERALAELDVTPAQYVILAFLARYPGISNADLARVSALTPQTVNLIVRRLTERGLAGRQRHVSHGRVVHLVIAPDGRELLRACDERARSIENDLMQGLDARRQAELRQWLQAVATG